MPSNPTTQNPITPPAVEPTVPETPSVPENPPIVEPVTKYYYNGLVEALEAIGNDSFVNDDITTPTEQSGVEVFIDGNDMVNIGLLKSFDLSETVQVGKDLNLILSGKTLNFSSELAMKIVDAKVKINGSESGSKVVIGGDESTTAKLFEIESGSLSINGGQYESSTSDAGTSASSHSAIVLKSGELDFKNATITASDNNGGTIQGINIASGCTANLSNTNVTISSKSGLEVRGVETAGTVTMSNCSILAYSDYTAKNNNYATNSRGIYSTGTLTLKNCTVRGTHAGITSKGALYIDGGSYSGYGHGGVYIGSEGVSSYIKNARLFDGPMPDGYIADSIAGTNGAGMYVGGASNVSVYVDNCEIEGVYYSVVMRNSGGETNNSLYISNSTLVQSRYIRTRTSSGALKVYLGLNNVIGGEKAVDYDAAKVVTETDYGTLFPEF